MAGIAPPSRYNKRQEFAVSVFRDLQAFRDRPIPPPPERRGYYRELPIEKDGAANKEPLVRASDFGAKGENFYASDRNAPYCHVIPGAIADIIVREGVAKRLQRVNAQLANAELELHVFDAWRPQAVQSYFHDVWLPNAFKQRDPSLSGEALTRKVETYWAAPSKGENAPSPHATGGAVDLTVRWRGGDPLWMGSLFDDASPIARTDHFEAAAEPFSFTAEEARANRRMLYWLMREAGFASNPSEWWHFSYGDQMWAQITGAPAALYSGADYTS
jgi:D-alanyl-D-alanine dipeptidase